MVEVEAFKQILDYGVATLAIIAVLGIVYVLFTMTRSKSKDDNGQNEVVKSLVGLVDTFVKQTATHSNALEVLIQKSQLQNDALTNQTNNLVANTSAIMTMNKSLNEEFIPKIQDLLIKHQDKILGEFKPVVELLSAIGLGVDAQNKALLEHRKSEQLIQDQQKKLNDAVINVETIMEKIFQKVIEDVQAIPQEIETITTPVEKEESAA